MVGDGFASYTIPASDGDVIRVDIDPVVDGDEAYRELKLTVPMGLTAGEIRAALTSLDLDPAAPVLRSERRDDYPRRMVLVFRLP